MIKSIKTNLITKMPVFFYETTDSTNLRAREYLKTGKKTPALFIANSQSAGRGRLGKSFYSPKDTGIYMTYAFSPEIALDSAVSVTTVASVAVMRAIERVCGKKTMIKWVNDLYLDGKKVCGILAEAVTDGAVLKHIIIGVGINLTTAVFPDDIKDTAGSIGSNDKARLIGEIANEFAISDFFNFDRYIDEYKSRSMVLLKEITYIENGKCIDAVAVDIDSAGGLVVRHCDGSLKTLRSGEISIKMRQT